MNALDAAATTPPPAEIRLWDGPAPLSITNAPPERIELTGDIPPNRRVYNVSVPTLTIYSPPRDKNSGIAVVICPGGGYAFLSWDKEGLNVAEWLRARGVTGAVLKYRLPYPERVTSGHLVPLLDAQRAVRLLRERADEFGINTNRIGILGFSAGGHLAAYVATRFTEPVTNTVENVARVSCRPDFCALAYPVISMITAVHGGSRTNLLGSDQTDQLRAAFSCEKLVTAQTPSVFILHARDDKGVPVENTLMFADACRKAGVPVEMHLYDEGGHGFGLGVRGGVVTNWPSLLNKFLDRYR